jgi:hypothetical protein
MANSPNSSSPELKTYGETQFLLAEGYYTIHQLEDLIDKLKEAEARMKSYAAKSMGVGK